MALTEAEVRQVLLVRALERAADRTGIWTDDDARAATAQAHERVGGKAPFDRFLAARAAWAIERLASRDADPRIGSGAPWFSPAVPWLIWTVALLLGLVGTQLFADGHINVIEWPIVGLILWNLANYLLLAGRMIGGLVTRHRRPSGLFAQTLVGLASSRVRRMSKLRKLAWMTTFLADQALATRPLILARIGSVLHVAAALVPLGAILNIYWRGLGEDYRAVWKSTWLSAENVDLIARWVLGPGEWLHRSLATAVRLPDLAHIASLQYQPGHPGDPAAHWIHLYAAAILVWILVPRLLLAALCRLRARRLQRALPIDLDTAYFSALRAAHEGRHPRALVLAFRHQTAPRALAGLRTLLERLHGQTVEIEEIQATSTGPDQTWEAALARGDAITVVMMFNLTAVAMPGTHDRFVREVLRATDRRVPAAVIVDESTYPDRDPVRGHERRNQWRRVLEPVRCEPVFADLTAPDDDARVALDARLDRHA